MSFSIPATLNVIERTGRKGSFMVAELITDIGTFDLKHRVLEQFQEGNYQGVFIITRIYTQSVVWKNGTWTKLCADLDWEALRIMAQADEAIPSTGLAVAEMVAEEAADEEVSHEPAASHKHEATADTVAKAATDDENLIADLNSLQQKIALSEPVRLDATMEDRMLFRQLRDELKANGYRFNAMEQSWHLAAQGG